MAHRLDCHLGVGIGALAGREQSLLAEPAFAAADREGDHDAVADPQIGDLGPERHDLTHILMAEDVAGFHRRLVAVEQVEIGAADRAGGDLDDRIARVLDLGIGDGVDAHVALTVPA